MSIAPLVTPLPQITQPMIDQLIAIARAAGAAILEVYEAPTEISVTSKSDESPLTAADLAAHNVILHELPALLSVPVISEESQVPPFSERTRWPCYWLIDPLDGTREFIARNGEFTVNIALIVNHQPLLGVVHQPVGDTTYLGVDASIAVDNQTRAEKYQGTKRIAPLKTRSLEQRFAAHDSLDLLVSHRHGVDAVNALMDKLQTRWPGPLEHLNAGSSLKFCLVAEGKADFYPRLAPTCEWDTAAAQAVLVAAGGLVVNAGTLLPLNYNDKDSLLNPSFFALGDAAFDWKVLLAA